MFKKNSGLIVGLFAIVIWSLSAALISCIILPPFEALTLALLASLIYILIKTGVKKEWYKLKINWYLCLFLGLNEICYYLSFQYASPIIVDIIIWLWPIMFILIVKIKHQEAISKIIYFALIAGILSAYIVTPMNFSFTDSSYLGIILAFIANAGWCGYMLVYAKTTITPDTSALCLTLSLPFIAVLHFIFEPNIVPQFADLIRVLILGVFSLNIAFYAWSYACQNYSQIKLSAFSYMTPVLSIMWLVFLNKQVFSVNLIIAIFIVLSANYICNKKI